MPEDQTTEYRGDTKCSLAKAVDIVGERWVFFIIREALAGVTRFAEFKARLGVAPDILTARLALLVDSGIMARQSYQDSGERTRHEYVLTESGRELALPIFALQQWGERFAPSSLEGSITFTTSEGDPVAAAFVSAQGSAPVDVIARRVDEPRS